MCTAQESEAILRLRQLQKIYGLGKRFVDDFEDKQFVHCVATTMDYVERMDWVYEQLENLRKEKKILPYYAILDKEMITVLYVGTYEEDWVKERPDYLHNQIFAYVINTEIPEYSEFGTVNILGYDDAVLRVYFEEIPMNEDVRLDEDEEFFGLEEEEYRKIWSDIKPSTEDKDDNAESTLNTSILINLMIGSLISADTLLRPEDCVNSKGELEKMKKALEDTTDIEPSLKDNYMTILQQGIQICDRDYEELSKGE